MLARLQECLTPEQLAEDGQARGRDEQREDPEGDRLRMRGALDTTGLQADGERLIDVADRGELTLERWEVGRTAAEADGGGLVGVDESPVRLEEGVREVQAREIASRQGELPRHRFDRHDVDRHGSLRRRARTAERFEPRQGDAKRVAEMDSVAVGEREADRYLVRPALVGRAAREDLHLVERGAAPPVGADQG